MRIKMEKLGGLVKSRKKEGRNERAVRGMKKNGFNKLVRQLVTRPKIWDWKEECIKFRERK